LRAIALYRSMLRDIPVLASAADLPLVAWSQRPDTLATQMSPKASAIFVQDDGSGDDAYRLAV
jgi:hypothetical protein